ncbi:MAG: hypothetical protein ACHQF2_05455 [Flavobacteriales bacterium]
MKIVIGLFLISLSLQAGAQLKPRTVIKKKGNYMYAYHQNGKRSTEIFRPKNTQTKGYAIAYNNIGTNIYKKEISRTNMISSVEFTYYENGAVKSARYSWHPDGGIQWGKETTFFDETGKITNTTNESNEDLISPVLPAQPVEKIRPNRDTIIKNPCDSLLPLDYGVYRDTTIENMFLQWHRTEFNRICTKNKIQKISCAGCTSVFADLKIEIDGDGKVKSMTVIAGRACGLDLTEQFKKDVIESLSKFNFPTQCYNGCFEKRIGRALKC